LASEGIKNDTHEWCDQKCPRKTAHFTKENVVLQRQDDDNKDDCQKRNRAVFRRGPNGNLRCVKFRFVIDRPNDGLSSSSGERFDSKSASKKPIIVPKIQKRFCAKSFI
jgi:hypothetical protein